MSEYQQSEPVDEARLPRPPGVFRRALAARPRAVDLTIVAVYLFGCVMMELLEAVSGNVDPSASSWLGLPANLMWPTVLLTIVRVVVIAIALRYRRRYPLAGLIAVIVLLLGEQSLQALPNGVALMFMLYAVPVYRGVVAAWIGYAVAVIGTTLSALLEWSGVLPGYPGAPSSLVAAEGAQMASGDVVGLIVMSSLWYLAVVMFGINLGNRRRYLAAIIDRAHQLARERDQLAQLAVAEERSRIAREMHDIVAHSVSVMIALSDGAARAAAHAPEAATDAMQRSAETGRSALAEMRRLLGALNEPGEASTEYLPQPGVSSLPELVEGFRDAGLDAQLRVSGDAAGDRGQDLAVYRVVQEGLTNVLRYAGVGAFASVVVERSTERSTVIVQDSGPVTGSNAPVRGLGSGRGLRGLEERVRVFGGTLQAGPVAGGGWRLSVILPVSDAAREQHGSTPHPGHPTEAIDAKTGEQRDGS